MSLLRYKQKLYPLSMGNPQGGGGGIVSSIGNALASIDPGPAIGNALASVDNAVNQVPGGWYTVGGLAAGGTALAFAPEIAAAIGAESGTQITTAAGQQAFFDSLAAGGTGAEAASAGLAADAAAAAASTGLGASDAITQALPYTEAFDAANLASQGLSQEAIAQNLTASGLNDFIANDIAGLASQGLDQDAINQALQYSYSSQELAPLHLESLQASVPEGVNVKDVIKNANRARQLAGLITGGSVASGVKPTAQQFAQFQQANAPLQEQFGGLYRMNQNPFAQTQQPTMVQNPLGKTKDFLSELSQENKPTPTLADLLRNA